MSVERLQVQQKDPVGDTVWMLARNVDALQNLANDAQPFFRTEVQDLRRAASDLLMIAAQCECNMKSGGR